jgi:hypothetical protein
VHVQELQTRLGVPRHGVRILLRRNARAGMIASLNFLMFAVFVCRAIMRFLCPVAVAVATRMSFLCLTSHADSLPRLPECSTDSLCSSILLAQGTLANVAGAVTAGPSLLLNSTKGHQVRAPQSETDVADPDLLLRCVSAWSCALSPRILQRLWLRSFDSLRLRLTPSFSSDGIHRRLSFQLLKFTLELGNASASQIKNVSYGHGASAYQFTCLT